LPKLFAVVFAAGEIVRAIESALLTPHPYWPVRRPSDAPAERATNQKTRRRSGRTFPSAEFLAGARRLALLASTFWTSNSSWHLPFERV